MFWRTRSNIEPCLPRPAKEPPVGSGWIHEIKHDGCRNFRDYWNARSRWLVRRPALEIDLQARTVNGMPITQLSDTQIAAPPVMFSLREISKPTLHGSLIGLAN